MKDLMQWVFVPRLPFPKRIPDYTITLPQNTMEPWPGWKKDPNGEVIQQVCGLKHVQ